jgi:hypothetical protein
MRALFLFTAIVISTSVFAQDKIEYVFNRNTDGEIKKFLNTQIKKDSLKKFYFILSRGSTKDDYSNFHLSIGVYKDATLDFLDNIIRASSRVYKFDKIQIPICFDYDFSFIGYGQDKRGVPRKHLTGEDYYIEFSTSDKIIKTGY